MSLPKKMPKLEKCNDSTVWAIISNRMEQTKMCINDRLLDEQKGGSERDQQIRPKVKRNTHTLTQDWCEWEKVKPYGK